ncbi:MAG: hypothetical protein C4324_06260 [Blastocatellia bacterium]
MGRNKIASASILFGLVTAFTACWNLGSGASHSVATTPSISVQFENRQSASPSRTPSDSKRTRADNANANNAMKETLGAFRANLPVDFEEPIDPSGELLLREYGAVFLARGGAIPPKKVVFKDEADVRAFQDTLKIEKLSLGGHELELQAAAAAALKQAVKDAAKSGLKITPRGADSARRTYSQTVELWASRVKPGLVYWCGKGRISTQDAERIRTLSPFEQVPIILDLEKKGIYFSKDFSKSIIFSVAPPGASQHLSMLALDIAQFDDPRIREIMAKFGWFQTVVSDLPHFTFLGVSRAELSGLGLKRVETGGREYWVPDI